MFLELKGRVKLFTSISVAEDHEWRKRMLYLVQRNKRRTSSHIGRLGAWMDAPFGVCVEGRLLDLCSLASGIRAHQWRFRSDLDFGRRRGAR